MIDHDRLNSADDRKVAQAAMTVIDRLQNFPREVQLLGMAAAFLSLCHVRKAHPGDLFATANNVMNGVAGMRPEFRAVAEYVEKEL